MSEIFMSDIQADPRVNHGAIDHDVCIDNVSHGAYLDNWICRQGPGRSPGTVHEFCLH